MNDIYNLKKEIKEIMKAQGGLKFFSELNAIGIPFFFVAAASNSEKGTEYICETITPSSIGLHLADDKFADFLDIRNNGFVAVPDAALTSESIQALKKFNETRNGGAFYSNDALMEFAKEQGIEIVGSGELDDIDSIDGDFPSGASRNVIDSVVRHGISGNSILDENGPEQIPVSVCHCETLDINWGTDGGHAYGEGFLRIDERHKGILKGNGSFLQKKEHEAVSYELKQPQPVDGGTACEKDAEGAERTEDTAQETDAG